MNMRARAITLATATMLAGGVLAGCGGDDEPETGGAAPAAETMESTPAETSQDIVALASGNDDLSTLVQAVTAAELVETLQGDGPFTVFAPTNEAFEGLGDTLTTLLEPENKDDLANVLTYHVVPGELMAADLEDGQQLETVQGETLEVSIEGDEVKVGDATVVTADVDASNGVVHVIDTVLQP